MTHDDAFLQDIIEAPDDDGPTQHVLVFPKDAQAAADVLLQGTED